MVRDSEDLREIKDGKREVLRETKAKGRERTKREK